jgi:hypothetical protein
MPVNLPDVDSTALTVSEIVALVLTFAYAVRRALHLVISLLFSELVGKVGCSIIIAGTGEGRFVCASSISLKITFLLMRTTLLTKSHILNMVITSYPISHNFSNLTAIFPSSLACGFSAYAVQPKVLICLYRSNVPYSISCEILPLNIALIGNRFVR